MIFILYVYEHSYIHSSIYLSLQLHAPTGVTHSVSAFLTVSAPPPGTPADASPLPNLVVVRSTSLEIYAANKLQGGSTTTSDIKLELLAQQRLFGVVESLAVLSGRSGRSGRDAILLTFRDAKLSVLQWDPFTADMVPSSLHYFEGDESLKAGRQAFPRPPIAVTDPAGRCAAVVMLRHQLAVLPATESESAALGMGDDPYALGANFGAGSAAAAAGETVAAALGNSYVDNLSKMHIREIRDAVFLYGAAEPTLLVLHEGDPTWAGNLRLKKDSCALTALSLNLSAKRHPKIWGAQSVPYDAYKIVAVPSGGALVFCTACILYYAQGQQAGVVLHSAAIPAAQPPPPLAFDLTKEAPGVAAAKYAREHATELHPLAASAALQFCDTSTAGWNLECDAAHAVWLSRSTAMVGLKTGQMILVEVVRLGGGTVKIRVAKAGAAPAASAMTVLSPSVAFIGSCAGDSLLIGCTLSTSATTATSKKSPAATQGGADGGGSGEAPDAKRRRLESSDADHVKEATRAEEGNDDDALNENKEGESEDEDEEALLLYGAEGDDTNTTTTAASSVRCTLRVLDSFIGIGPVRSLVSSTSGASGTEAPYLVACCGKDKGGALAVIRRSVAPDVMTEVPLPGVTGAWAVGNSNAHHHSYLLLSYPQKTMVLATGGEQMQDVTNAVEFARDTPTIGAGTLAQGKRIVQAFAQGIRLLDEQGRQQQELLTSSDFCSNAITTTSSKKESKKSSGNMSNIAIASMHVVDPFVLLHMTNGTAVVLRTDDQTRQLVHSTSITIIQSDDTDDTHVTACCLYKDTCGWLQRQFLKKEDGGNSGSGGVGGNGYSYMCIACFSDGSLSIWSLSDKAASSATSSSNLASTKPLWRCGSLHEAPAVLVGGTVARAAGGGRAIAALTNADAATSIVEIRLESFDSPSATRTDLTKAPAAAPSAAAPLLIALSADNIVVAYKAFTCGAPTLSTTGAPSQDAAPMEDSLRFKRLHLDVPAIVPPSSSSTTTTTTTTQRLFSFVGLGEQIPHSGFFISGASPLWLIASRGTLFAHPLHLDNINSNSNTTSSRTVSGFTPFNTINSPYGFITVQNSTATAPPTVTNTTSCIQIAGLPPRQRLDAPWPRQKIAIKATPHKICLYPEAHLFAVAASRTTKYRPFLPEEDGGEPQASYSYALADAAAAARGGGLQFSQHEIRLVQPGTWATLWQYALLPGEVALSLDTVHLRDATTGATFPLLALGVGFNAGEDYPCSGRVLLFEVSRRSSNTDTKKSGWAAELIYAREFKGPVTGVATMEGNLLISTGNRLEICTLSTISRALEGGDDDTSKVKTSYKLTRSAFYDGPSLITDLCVVKTFALASDAAFSVQFVRYREEGRQLALLGKDFGRACVRAAQFLIAGSSLHLVMADAAGTIQTFTYSPNDPSTWKGTKLMPWGVMHIGEGVGAMTRLRMPQPSTSDTTVRQAVLYGSDTGALGAVMPLSVGEHFMQSTLEGSTFVSTLRALQREVATCTSHGAGLNPFAFRRRHGKIPPGLEGSKPYGGTALPLEKQGLLDGDLLMRFMWLPRSMQTRVAGRVGVTRSQVLQVLAAINRTSCLI
jgi:cleavage and polyadenylation specificity factor subunit 1